MMDSGELPELLSDDEVVSDNDEEQRSLIELVKKMKHDREMEAEKRRVEWHRICSDNRVCGLKDVCRSMCTMQITSKRHVNMVCERGCQFVLHFPDCWRRVRQEYEWHNMRCWSTNCDGVLNDIHLRASDGHVIKHFRQPPNFRHNRPPVDHANEQRGGGGDVVDRSSSNDEMDITTAAPSDSSSSSCVQFTGNRRQRRRAKQEEYAKRVKFEEMMRKMNKRRVVTDPAAMSKFIEETQVVPLNKNNDDSPPQVPSSSHKCVNRRRHKKQSRTSMSLDEFLHTPQVKSKGTKRERRKSRRVVPNACSILHRNMYMSSTPIDLQELAPHFEVTDEENDTSVSFLSSLMSVFHLLKDV